MKAHIFRELVNDLRDIATQRHGSEQLRERISERLRQDVSIDEDPANDGWIPWVGGECPVDSKDWVEAKLRDGKAWISEEGQPGEEWLWDYATGVVLLVPTSAPAVNTTIAYRIVRK